MRVAMLLFLGCLLFGCGSLDDNSGNSGPFAGNWSGTLVSEDSPPVSLNNFTMTLSQNDTSVTGFYTYTITDSPGSSGPVSGSINGSSVSLTLDSTISNQPPCPSRFAGSGTLDTTGTKITVTFTTGSDCTHTHLNNVQGTLTRQ